MCIGQPPPPAPPPPIAPTPIPVEELTAKTASKVSRATPRRTKRNSFRRKKSGGRRSTFNLTPKKTS